MVNRLPAITVSLLCALVLSGSEGFPQAKITAAELVARHLEAIGTPEARAAIRSRAFNGTVRVTFRIGNHGQHDGSFSLISEGNKVRLGMRFDSTEYAGEQLAFDGKDSSTGFIRPRVRSTLGTVFYQYDHLLREGFLGGSSSLAWPLLEVDERQPMLEYEGLKDVEGVELHQLKYRAKRGDQGFTVSLFFDPQTFHHVRSRYRLKIGHLIGPTDLISARQQPTFVTILEDFGDYRTIDGIALAHTYKMSLDINRKDNSIMTEWVAEVKQVFHNRNLNPKFFRIN